MTKQQAKKVKIGEYLCNWRSQLVKVLEVVNGGESFRLQVIGSYHTGVMECRRTGIQTSDPTYWDDVTEGYTDLRIVKGVKFID